MYEQRKKQYTRRTVQRPRNDKRIRIIVILLKDNLFLFVICQFHLTIDLFSGFQNFKNNEYTRTGHNRIIVEYFWGANEDIFSIIFVHLA